MIHGRGRANTCSHTAIIGSLIAETSMNKGIQKASGEYLLFLNSGDVLNNSAVLADIHGFLSGEDIVYGDLVFVRGDGEETVFTDGGSETGRSGQ